MAGTSAATPSSGDRMERLLRRVDPGSTWFASSAASQTGAADQVKPLRYLPI
ncbi:hypothetical protein Q7L71_09750 [Conexibacter sp. CPCC 205706]|uniref:hypothetical protein n=1 Tax=Conexibacter sp. CPCC 205706 TaxID=3064572 RepID=UPI002716386C|nr:hypothetical protein [Conexibacter sp. CPCC 205706]MDO8185864.1 hypothetical protein [Conexibacter sp. CPCC 205706]